MDLSPEEYGRYWRGSLRIAGGVLIGIAGYRFVGPLVAHSQTGATLLGWTILALTVVVGTFLAVLGIARVVRTAVREEL